MLAWVSETVSLASATNRSRNSARAASSARTCLMHSSFSKPPGPTSFARHTTAMPPSASGSQSWYLPNGIVSISDGDFITYNGRSRARALDRAPSLVGVPRAGARADGGAVLAGGLSRLGDGERGAGDRARRFSARARGERL